MANSREQDGKLQNDAKDNAGRNKSHSRRIASQEGKLGRVFVQIEPSNVEEERRRQKPEISLQSKLVHFVDRIKTNGADDSERVQASKRLKEAEHQLGTDDAGSPTSERQFLRSLHELGQGCIAIKSFFESSIRLVLRRLLLWQALVGTDRKKGKEDLENEIEDGSYKNEFDRVCSASSPLLTGKVHVGSVDAEPAQIDKYGKTKKKKVSSHRSSISFVKCVENEDQYQ
mmetsp:Transcript_24470/g.42095  ORF Transcript_24470/g.42095 Transcript_24470/m.42095 type:complete len:229 (+) Transcript_24470:268-954(+)